MRRKKVLKRAFTVANVEPEMLKKIERTAKKEGLKRSPMVKEMIQFYIDCWPVY